MPDFEFQQVDVFTTVPMLGNPLAVVIGADALSDAQMRKFSNWTNLSETVFLLRPRVPGADYRVRIFTPELELPFAGHPTMGACHVWLDAGGVPAGADIVQECGVGLVRVRRDGMRLAFAAPALRRSGAVAPDLLTRISAVLRIEPERIIASNWVENGPPWVAVMLESRDELLALQPDFVAMAGLEIGVVAPWPGGEADFEVRAFAPGCGVGEDPVTGSLNAGLAQWMMAAGLAPGRYVASQGTKLGRAGRVHVVREGTDIWVGGEVIGCIKGQLAL